MITLSNVQIFLKNILKYLLDKKNQIDDTLEKSFYFFSKKTIKGRIIPSVSTI